MVKFVFSLLHSYASWEPSGKISLWGNPLPLPPTYPWNIRSLPWGWYGYFLIMFVCQIIKMWTRPIWLPVTSTPNQSTHIFVWFRLHILGLHFVTLIILCAPSTLQIIDNWTKKCKTCNTEFPYFPMTPLYRDANNSTCINSMHRKSCLIYSLWLVDFGIGLVNSFLTLPERPVRFFGAISNYRSSVRQSPYKFMWKTIFKLIRRSEIWKN